MPPGPARRLFLLDGHSLSYRAFYALPTTLATSSGQITNAVYGFTSMLIKLLSEERPDLIAVAFDRGAPTVRLERDADYKAGRPEAPDEFRQQLGLIDEVLAALGVPVVGVEGHEADDVIATLATRAADRGIEVTIVTADRDFFQLVGPAITVMFNRKGISDIVRFDPAAVEERYGVPPDRYVDLVALRGDASDNIPGVPGIGDKTAAHLVREFGDVGSLLAATDRLTGKRRESVEAAADRVRLNLELARLVTDLELDVEPEDCMVAPAEAAEIRRLFTSLEFRTLLERYESAVGTAEPRATAEVDVSVVDASDLVVPTPEAGRPVGLAVEPDPRHMRAIAWSADGRSAIASAAGSPTGVGAAWASDQPPRAVHGAKSLFRAGIAAGSEVGGIVLDTELGAYLLDPGAGEYPLGELCSRMMGADPTARAADEDEGRLFGADDDAPRRAAASAAAVAALAPEIARRLDEAGLRRLHDDVELPLARILARMESLGIALDVEALRAMSSETTARMAELRAQIEVHAGESFNLNSPAQLRVVLFDRLGLPSSKRTPKGEPSTDASVLEKLRDAHPIVAAILSWRELDKLTSTYLEALPRQVDPADGRIHTTFHQTSAATGRLSSSDPNLQNIPARTELGRRIRAAFIAGGDARLLLCADYSQIELRILAHLSGDAGLLAAFEADEDIHTATAAKIFAVPPTAVDPSLRNRAKMVNYGLAYGMNAFGLASRLDIAPDEAQEIMDAYFAGFPAIADYLERQVEHATREGYTETLLGRRRYIPELRADNPRIRDLGRRMALNAPIQGSAADVFKIGMLAVARALDHELPDCRMLLTVHDELVFEVPEGRIEAAGTLVRREMEAAGGLRVPLRADLGWGRTWSDAAPAGH